VSATPRGGRGVQGGRREGRVPTPPAPWATHGYVCGEARMGDDGTVRPQTRPADLHPRWAGLGSTTLRLPEGRRGGTRVPAGGYPDASASYGPRCTVGSS
jgi:hypothetical protein